MRQLVQTLAVFAAAAGVNTGNVAIEQRTSFFTRRFGPRAWYVHLALVLPVWGGFLLQLRRVGRSVHWPLPRAAQPLGTLLLLAAGGLWLTAFTELGPRRTGNGNLFGRGSQAPVTGGVFRHRTNPMYDSYVLALVGLALRTRNAVYLLLAGEALLLCHGIEAPVENRPLAARHLRPAPLSVAAVTLLAARRAARAGRAGPASHPR
jgi:protein-S-isoprenylcysteine O-methyltransferase Ste14